MLAQSDAPDGHGWHGNALLVAREPKTYRRLRMQLPGVEPRGAIIAEVDFGEGPVRIIAAHFGLLRRSRISQANALLTMFSRLHPMPTILLGDLKRMASQAPVLAQSVRADLRGAEAAGELSVAPADLPARPHSRLGRAG